MKLAGGESWATAVSVQAEVWQGFEDRKNTLLVGFDLKNVYKSEQLPSLADGMLYCIWGYP